MRRVSARPAVGPVARPVARLDRHDTLLNSILIGGRPKIEVIKTPVSLRPMFEGQPRPGPPLRAEGGVAGRITTVNRGPVPVSVGCHRLSGPPAPGRRIGVTETSSSRSGGAPQTVGVKCTPLRRGSATLGRLPRLTKAWVVEARGRDRVQRALKRPGRV